MEDNSYETKLVISADTSDAEKKLKQVGKTKVDPIKVDVVADNVKIDTPKVAPVKIEADASSALATFAKVKKAVNGIGSAISVATRALGWIGLAISAGQALVGVFGKLKDKLEESARHMAKLRWDAEMRTAANETARLVGWHEKLAKIMKDELDTLSKQRSLANINQQGKKDYEDGRREADRARQIFEAKNPEEVQALRARFAAEDDQRALADRKAQRKQKIDDLNEQESVYSAGAKSLKGKNSEIDRQLENERSNLVRANGKEDEAEPIRKRIEALEQRKKANEAEIEQFEKEAKFRRDQITAIESQRDYEGPSAGSYERKAEIQRSAEAAIKDATSKQRQVEDAVLGRKKEQEIAKLDPNSKTYDRDIREIERQYALKAAQIKVERADNDTDRAVAIEEAKAVEIRNDVERRQERAGEDVLLESKREDYEKRLAQFDGVSQNRLTAMGLGSGVSGIGGIQSDVRRLVDLMRENVSATKNIKVGNTDSIAVYGE